MNGTDWLLDTNMVIGMLKRYAPAVILAEDHNLAFERVAVSQITRMELLGFPALTSEEESTIRAFLKNCRVILIEEAIEQKAIHLRRCGFCKLPDAIIVATAMVYQAKLLTLDRQLINLLERLEDVEVS